MFAWRQQGRLAVDALFQSSQNQRRLIASGTAFHRVQTAFHFEQKRSALLAACCNGLLSCSRVYLARASSSSELSDLPIAAELIEELHLIVARAPSDAWCSVSDVYGEIPASMRRRHVRPHKTMLHVLDKTKDTLGITLSTSGVYFAKGNPPPEAVPGAHGSAGTADGSNRKSTESNQNVQSRESSGVVAPSPRSAAHVSPGMIGGASGVFSSDVPPPVDFYYDVGLEKFPVPPADFDVTPSSLAPAQTSNDGSVLLLSDFVNYIPPFFVPLQAVLDGMPGYTEEHIDGYLATSKAMEMVHIGGVKYVRLYGGYAKIRLQGCEVAEEAFQQFKPKRSLMPAFRDAFSGITDQWMPLKLLLSRVDPSAVAALPFQGPAAIIYFAQMQDVFGFSVNKDGVTSSVLLRRPGFGGLEAETTPTPKTFNYLLGLTPLEGSLDVQVMLSHLPQGLKDEIAEYYGDIFAFFSAHAPVFFLSEDRSVVMRTSYKRRLHRASLPLEEQLQIATERRDKSKIRTLRRRIAFRDNPSHPFHDPDNLAREVAKFLPKKGFVTLKVFLKKHVPEEVLFFMPKKMHNFFANYPQYFQQFEYQQAGTWAISKPGQSLPRGVIRKDFSEDDLVALTAEYLQQKGSRACTTVFLHLPRGAQEIVRKRHGGLYYFVEKYPQYFSVVLGSDTENRQSSAVVHLVQLPAQRFENKAVEEDGDEEGSGDGGGGGGAGGC